MVNMLDVITPGPGAGVGERKCKSNRGQMRKY